MFIDLQFFFFPEHSRKRHLKITIYGPMMKYVKR